MVLSQEINGVAASNKILTQTLPPPLGTQRNSLFVAHQTLLHELCHAAAWVIDHKSKPPHGSHFWAWADRAKAAHPGVPVTTCHTYTINYKYRYVCVGASGDGGPADAGRGCGAEIGRHSKSINVQTQVGARSSDAAVLVSFFFRGRM